MSTSITEFLEDLAMDPDLEAAFDRAPRFVMKSRGVSDSDALLILGGTISEIREAIQGLAPGARVFLIKMRP